MSGLIARIYGSRVEYKDLLVPYYIVCLLTALANVLVVNWMICMYHHRKKKDDHKKETDVEISGVVG